jgi:hypothetical protein
MTMIDNEPNLEMPTIGGAKYDEYGLLIEDDDDDIESQMWPGIPVPGEAKLSEIEAWLSTQEDKFTTTDIESSTGLMYFATRYVKRFGPSHSNGFVKDIASKLEEYERLSPARTEMVDLYGTKLNVSVLPNGYYADPLHATGEADSRLKIKINKTDNGTVYVNDASVYGHGTLYGIQRPGGKYSGKVADVLERIIADPKSAMIAYGMLTGRCGNCHRKLEDAQSVADGIGPICKGKLGW